MICIFQDSRGFLWVGTQDGLNRYDGKEFRIYLPDPEDSASLSNAYIRTIFEDNRENLWIGTDGALDRLDRETGAFTHYWLDSISLQSNINRQLNIKVIYEDRNADLWIGTSLGLYRFNYQAGEPELIGALDENINGIYEVEGVLCFATFDGLKRLDQTTGQLESLAVDLPGAGDPPRIYPRCVLKDKRGGLWVGTHGQGVIRLDQKTGRAERLFHDPENLKSLSSDVISALYEDREGGIWIGTEKGLHRYDPRTDRMDRFLHDPDDPTSILGNHIMSLHQDVQDNLWIGTYGGLNRLDRYSLQFEHYRHDPQSPNSLSANTVTSVFGDSQGDLWIGTYGGGLDRLDTATGRFVHYRHDPLDTNSISGNVPWGIGEDDKGNIWIGTLIRGLNRWDRRTDRFDRFIFDWSATNLSARNGYNTIIRDRRGQMWMSGYGVFCRDPVTGAVLYHWYFPESKKRRAPYGAMSVIEDRRGMIWFGAGGLYCLNPLTGKTEHFTHDPDDPASIADNFVKSVCEGRDGAIWAGTNAGLSRLDRATGKFENFGVEDGLIDNTVQAIVEDDLGFLWLNTDRALVRFDPRKKTFRSLDTRDGLPAEGMSMASWKDPGTGKLYFGTISGLVVIQPGDIVENQAIPPVVLSRFVRYNSQSGRLNAVTDEWIQEQEAVTLSYRENVLEFEFAVLNFVQPWKNRYSYRLEGFHDQWISLGGENKVTFTNLDPGTYVLHVRGANNDGVWNEAGASLRFKIRPPWWRTWWAYGLYGSACVLLLIWSLRFQRSRVREKEEARRILELDAFKSRFYNNVTHEFRTPLTMILGMAERLEAGTGYARSGIADAADMIRRNSKYLLHLINQMLDLSRLETSHFQLHPVQGDVLVFLRYLLEPFRVYAAAKDIRIHLRAELELLIMDFDPDVMQDIMSNLLSNAIKFTPEGGDVYVQVAVSGSQEVSADCLRPASSCLLLQVRDTGVGIGKQHLSHIFDRFYKAENSTAGNRGGTGVGLALTRELVRLAGGTITVESAPGEGTEFTVRLPITRQAPPLLPENASGTKEPDPGAYFGGAPVFSTEREPFAGDDPRPLLLIIEDNADVVRYLKALLAEQYQLAVAGDGRQGIERALEIIPDIIVSDIMMPEKDGLEVCATLKKDERTSHIPIILLTARADAESRLRGLEAGADAYLVKPFNQAELEVRLRKLHERQQRFRNRYRDLIPPAPSEDRTEQREDAFLQKLNAVIEAHLDEETWHIDDLSEALFISRAQLHRKLKALTGRSASHYLRSFRMQKARELLHNRELNISEVALEVGYKDPSYFTRSFVEEFGFTPSAYRKGL